MSMQKSEIPTTFVTELAPDALERAVADLGLPAFRGRQILKWLYERACVNYAEMTDLPRDLRARLTTDLPLVSSRVVEIQKSRDGTRKVLIGLHDGRRVETVMIPEGDRRTACLSSQVGCPIGCVFCASGQGGLERSLTAGEIVEQWLHVTRLVREEGDEGLTRVVIMGMGEPLLNFGSVMEALERLNDERCAGFGARRITVSTVGRPSHMDRLAKAGIAVNLAISLHAADDETRGLLVPANRRWPLADVVAAANRYRKTCGRDVTFEYVLLDGVNDSDRAADLLAQVAGKHFNVNLIPYNPVEGLPYAPSPRVNAFAERLRSAGIVAHVRRRRGGDIDAACGQLRLRREP
jgi:23S rRNA (adenine2503-C2)-methyltransferase